MKRTFVCLILTVCAGFAIAQDQLAIRVTLQVVSSDPEQTSLDIADWADRSGGYYTYRSDDQVIVRIPPDLVPALRSLVEESDDSLVAYNPAATDHGEEIRRISAAINSRNESLTRILIYLESSDVAATLEFERELRSLLQEIEYHTGRARRLQNEIAFADVTVNLSSRQRSIPERRPSNFPWVTTVDLYRFLEEVLP